METHRIGIISDTHGLLRPEVEEKLKSCEIILHAGDIDRPEILEKLKAIAPVYAVRGNADRESMNQGDMKLENMKKEDMDRVRTKFYAGMPGEKNCFECSEATQEKVTGNMPADLPEELDVSLFGFRFYMVHNKKHIRKELTGIDAVIFGHSHKYDDFCEAESGIRYLNPGSCGPKRFRLPITMMLLTVYPAERRMEIERIDCVPAETSVEKQKSSTAAGGSGGQEEKRNLSEKDMYRLVKNVMKGVKAGRSVAEIAFRNQAEEKLVEDICRMYVTHPGVDVDGIMDRLERRGL